MTDCPNGEIRDLLPDLLHERLAPAERALVEAHVAGCADCRDELALLRQLRGTMHRTPSVDVGAIVRALPAYQAPVRRSWGGWRAAAAIAAIAVGGTSVAIARHGEPVPATQPVVVASAVPVAAPSSLNAPVEAAVAPQAEVPATHAAARPRELAMAGAVSDLSDGELAALLADIQTIDVVPARTADVETGSLAPATVAEPTRGAS